MIPKFRAWDEHSKQWVEHFYITENGLIYNMEKPRLDFMGAVPIEKSGLILMQSTGLKDKNGAEIFEKDIVKNKDGRLAIVKWHGSYASFIYDWIDELEKPKRDWQPLYLSYMKFEVIGNIWEHPHLLEVAE